jgi:lysine 2,3-aminomutase
MSTRLPAICKQLLSNASREEWNDWTWQLRHRITDFGQLAGLLGLPPEDARAYAGLSSRLPLSITPYYAALLAREAPPYPLRKAVVPSALEQIHMPEESEDPLGEERHSPVPGLVHRYPDRVLLLVTDFCPVACRYCTRSRRVDGQWVVRADRGRWQAGLDYIARHPEIRDVLLSGGDPLTLGDDALGWLLGELRRIPHVEVVRIGSKVPAVLPQRITRELTQMLRRHHPLWMSLHFTHPAELTRETERACSRLADAGIPLGSQTVLLKSVNDDADTLRALWQGLMRVRVRPYYLYQCDPILGSSHFRTPVRHGLEIIKAVRGHTSGYAVPTFVIDAPGGGGKIPLQPDYVDQVDERGVWLESFTGTRHLYPESSPDLDRPRTSRPPARLGCAESACRH